MNILIKLTCLVGLVIAPILGDGHGHDHGQNTTDDNAPKVVQVSENTFE